MEVHIRGRYKWDGAGEGREICPRAKPLSTWGRARRKQGRALRRAPGTQAGRRGRGTSPYVSRVSVEAGGLGERRMLGLWPGTWLWNENVTFRAEVARRPCAGGSRGLEARTLGLLCLEVSPGCPHSFVRWVFQHTAVSPDPHRPEGDREQLSLGVRPFRDLIEMMTTSFGQRFDCNGPFPT